MFPKHSWKFQIYEISFIPSGNRNNMKIIYMIKPMISIADTHE